MTFASFKFVLLFLPVMLLLYHLAGRKNRIYAEYVLIAASLYFYACFGAEFLLYFIVYSTVNLLFCRILLNNRNKMVFVTALIMNILMLLYFRYTNFFIDCMNHLTDGNLSALNLAVPVGISYFTFQTIALLSDVYNGKIQNLSTPDYYFFMLYFPKIIQGPILQYHPFMDEFHEKTDFKVTASNMAYGIQRFAKGLAKKILLADVLGAGTAYTFANLEAAGSVNIILTGIFYTLQLYLDFSGYCDMACGISRMFGIRLPENFNAPYKALSIGDFWKRWHISLTDFLRKYIYFPLGGSRKGRNRTYLNIMIIFLISGFWHGANWTFILWGLLHGILSCLDRMISRPYQKVPKVIRWFVTMVLVMMLWLLFRSESIEQYMMILRKLADPGNFMLTGGLYDAFNTPVVNFYDKYTFLPQWILRFCSMITVTVVSSLVCVFEKNNHNDQIRLTLRSAFFTAFCLIWSMLSMSSLVEFLYQNF